MKMYFLLLLSSYKLNTLTFENMFNNELENVLKEREKEYKRIESEACCNIIVFFSFNNVRLEHNSITKMKNNFFSEFNIKNTGTSIISIEHDNRIVYFKNGGKYHFKRFLEKIEQKLKNPDVDISKISPDHHFGIITEGIIDTKDKHPTETSQKDIVIADNYPEDDDHYAKKFGDDFIIQKDNYLFNCLFSNFQMTKPDFEYCFKIFDLEK
ncbi:hypothetical protein GVAV_001591 [Gurleya vavrai]